MIPLQYWQGTMPCSKTWWLKNTVNIQCMNYEPFIRIKENKKQTPHDVKSFVETLHLSCTYALSWVDFYVSFMFCSFLVLTLISVYMFLSCFKVYFPNLWSITY
jgi:hypothetical protein